MSQAERRPEARWAGRKEDGEIMDSSWDESWLLREWEEIKTGRVLEAMGMGKGLFLL